MDKIEERILPFLNRNGYILEKIEDTRIFNQKVIRIVVDKEKGITSEDLTIISRKSVELLEDLNILDNYSLEVTSPGVIKEIQNDETLIKHIGKYVKVKLKDEIFLGYLEDVSDLEIELKINIKGRIKKIKLERNKIKKINIDVKF